MIIANIRSLFKEEIDLDSIEDSAATWGPAIFMGTTRRPPKKGWRRSVASWLLDNLGDCNTFSFNEHRSLI